MDHLRQRVSRRRALDRFGVSTTKVQPSEAFEQTWYILAREEVHQTLKTLPGEQLEILELVYFHDYTYREIAERLELPLGTVKDRVRLGLKPFGKPG